jgi:hypothetical protein
LRDAAPAAIGIGNESKRVGKGPRHA